MTRPGHVAKAGLAVALAIGTHTACPAQSSGACPCPPPKLVPITGRVLDAVTGRPIAGAVVHYFDSNPPLDRAGDRVRQPIVGEVKSAADGSYALTADLPLSSFHVRASAPGYFAAAFYDEPAIVGQKWPADFPPRPSHDLNLQPNHDLAAVGSSLFTSTSSSLPTIEVTAAALSPDNRSILLAMRGPELFLIALQDVHVTAIALPEELTRDHIEIKQLGWDGTHLIFTAENGPTPFVGGASAPEFHATLLPAPSIFAASVSIGTPNFSGERFTVEEVSSCDEDDPSPHCGQSGSLVVHDTANGKTIPIKSGAVDDLSYLLQPDLGTIVFSDPEETSVVRKVPTQVIRSGQMTSRIERPRLTLLDLNTGQRSNIALPGDGSRTLTLLAAHQFGQGGVGGMRVAYSREGDCDPQSTDAAQPFAPAGLAGVTPNAWSVCIVTVPFPPRPRPDGTHAAAKTR